MTDETENARKDKIVKEAHDRCEDGLKVENLCRNLFKLDMRFANADSDNGDQWDQDDRSNREADRRPCLTVNKVRQFNLNIINDGRQNKPAIKFMARGNGATYESAQIWTAIARWIEAQSNASDAYDTARKMMVDGGFGWSRIITEYVSDDSFLQQIRIARIPDPLKVLVDPYAVERDKSDANWGLLFEDTPKKEFDKLYPEYADLAKTPNFGAASQGAEWVTDDYIRTAEYFRVEHREAVLCEVQKDDETPPFTVYKDEILPEIFKTWKLLRWRDVKRKKVMWNYIVGKTLVEEQEWPGKTVPLIPWIAEELRIDGQIDRKSHTRALKDPQRIYNWYTSTAVEFGALQTKTPWLAPAQAIEGIEADWGQANKVNKAVLTYNAVLDDGTEIPAPQRIQPPVSTPLAMDGMRVADEEMSKVSGQYESQLGAPSNERSGKAINERQRQGDRATYHYIDAEAVAIRRIGRELLDLVPKVYSEQQVIQILAEDGQSLEVLLDPEAKQAYEVQMNEDNIAVQRIFNPGIGQYDVMADVGPGYATRREETFNALVLLLTQAPQLTGVLGDLLLKAADFEYADEAAQRLRRMLPPQALGQGPSQNEQMLMAQVQKLKELLAKTLDEFAGAKVKLKSRDEKREVEIYRAFTERLKVLEAGKSDERSHAVAVAQLIQDLAAQHMENAQSAVEQHLRMTEAEGLMEHEVPPLPGAQKAPDGHWMIPDPMRKGKWLRVLPQQEGAVIGGGRNEQNY